MADRVVDTPRPTVFLDRDGVINRKVPEGRYVTRWEEFEFLPGAVEALAILKRRGARLIVASNQRGVARGAMTLHDVEAIHARMRAELRAADADVDAIYVCPHEEGTCDCRKPRLGLFRLAFAADPTIDLDRAVLVGDSASDLFAGNDLGVRTVFVGSAERLTALRREHPNLRVDARAGSLRELVDAGVPYAGHVAARPSTGQ